ncbi:hypothetical protein P691DRAFT_781502 [Macrolepiota fuliginosa MF-IS2]|uniref:Uncharacterized protein n=1 Tax=Macrolepiota fuliginosa MF-IS2 TaxID=1400762 RepID=A0A9P5WZT8_9AGAR|nr:hypothetical protein P691DRAFT_781502 [Macrolepiota fuliginosa MF-IS2]
MLPSSASTSLPLANRVKLLPYGVDALKFSLDSCLVDQLANIKAHIASIKCKYAEATIAIPKKATVHPKPQPVVPALVIPVLKVAAPKVVTPKVTAPKVTVPHPSTNVLMSSPPPETLRALFLSPPPPKHCQGELSQQSAIKIPWLMVLQDAAFKAHKKTMPKPVPESKPVPDQSSTPKPKSVHKEWTKAQNNKEFIWLCGIAAPALVLSRVQHLFAVPSPEAMLFLSMLTYSYFRGL